MSRGILIAFVVAVIVVIIICAGMIWYNKWIRGDLAATKAAMLAVEHICPDGCQEVVERWSELGYARYCVKDGKRNGNFVAWEGQRLHLEGYYLDGEKHGRWTIYNTNGTIAKIIVYDNGKQVVEKEMGPGLDGVLPK